MKKYWIIFLVVTVILHLAWTVNYPACLKLQMPAAITIYSESRLATNIETNIYPGDTLYFCRGIHDY